MSKIHLFKENIKYIDKGSIYLYQDYRRYSIKRQWYLCFRTDKLYKSYWKLSADRIGDFVDYIDDIFSDGDYRKTDWLDIRDNNYYHNNLQLKLF